MSIIQRIAICCCLGLAAASAAEAAQAGSPAPAQSPRIRVGTVLVALRTVSLRQATLQKGARVRVVAIALDRGRPVALDLELGDGHVLRKVAYRKVADNFRPID